MTPSVDPAVLARAVDLVREAGELTLRWFRTATLEVERKGDGTPVTQADRAAERLIRESLAAWRPDDAVVGEEEDDTRGTSGSTWWIDPIDGTKAFSHGVPLYSNLLALSDEHGPAIGIINLPALGETVYAARGLGCFLDGAPCRVSTVASFADAYLCTSGLGYWPEPELRALLDAPCTVRTWGDGYGYALVATGRVEAMVDPEVKPYDVAPMPVILAEAGGRFTDLVGRPGWHGGSGAATNGLVHDDVLALFRSSRS